MEETINKIGRQERVETKKYAILYVDDEETNLRVFKSNFRRFFKIYTAVTPFDAIEMLKEYDIQVIITDQRMPDMTGTEFLEKILPDFPDVVKIILTGFTDIEAIKDGINRCGIFKYITKPWNFDEMKAVLDRAMQTYQNALDSDEHVKDLEISNTELERRVAERTSELNAINDRLISSIKYAGQLQLSMLPSERYMGRLFKEYFLMFKTRYFFSEEFIWTTSLNFRTEDYTAIAVLEFDGKGIVGSLKTLIADSILNELVQDRKIFHSGDVIRYLKEELDAAGSQELYCDLKASVCIINNNDQTLQFSGLEQNLMIMKGNELTLVEGDTQEGISQLKAERLPLDRTATYYMYSNGFYNQVNPDGVKFSREKFEELIKSIQGRTLVSQQEFLNQTIEDWIGESGMNGDISIVAFRI